MSTRYLIAVALMVGSACGAQAAVVGWNGGMHASVTRGGAALPSQASNATGNSNADLAAALQDGKIVTSDGKIVDPGKSAADVVHGAPSGNFNNSGNGAVVITPPVGGQEGGAIVQLPIPAKNATPGRPDLGQDSPVILPEAPAAAVPEPSSIALMMAGVLGALGVARRRKR